MLKLWRLNPYYLFSRVRNYIYFKNNLHLPWMTKDANNFLEKNLDKNMCLLEFGSGRSTLFFANKVKIVYSREHDEYWYKTMSAQLGNIENIKYDFFDNMAMYINVDEFENESLDVVVVDGRDRANCVLKSIPKIKIGGLLVLDNAERYLMYATRSPAKFVRTNRDPLWVDVEVILKNNFWRFDTTDGVSDTVLFVKRK